MEPSHLDRKGASPIAGYVVLFILCIGGLAGMVLGVASRTKKAPEPTVVTESETPPLETAGPPALVAPPAPEGKLEVTDLVVGKGTEAKDGDEVSAHYVGTLTDGKEFDSSRKHGQPFKFPLGQGRVIKGWDQGIKGMKVGGKRKLVIPPSLGYGARGAGATIPPNATLIFEVELIDVKPGKPSGPYNP